MHKSQILIISPEPWNGHFVSKHHYALTLPCQGHEVYFLNPPDNSLKEKKIQKTEHLNVWEVSAPQVAKGLRFYPKFLRNLLERRWLEKLEAHIGQSFTTVWLFENSRFYDMDFAGDRTKIYHQVDSNQNFHLKEASKSADICFCTTDYIKNDLFEFADNVHKVHHGVTLNREAYKLTVKEEAYFSTDAVNVVYIGNMDISFFDIALFYTLVCASPDVIFHLIGNYTPEKPLFLRCKNLKNIRWWGRIDSFKIASVLALSDAQLLIYKGNNIGDIKQLASPHKMMEYFASGKVTVATYTDEYKDKRELLEMVDDSTRFVEKFSEVVNDLAYYNSKEKQQIRLDFAKENSYEKQLDKIVGYLKQYNLKL